MRQKNFSEKGFNGLNGVWRGGGRGKGGEGGGGTKTRVDFAQQADITVSKSLFVSDDGGLGGGVATKVLKFVFWRSFLGFWS